ncbi:MAG TPA: response regulator [Vicinamibacterales bacterium]|nr:response regulator [Vicinamibacterales bacterium]
MSSTETTVLIVDDDEPTQKLLQAVMRRVGLDSAVAPNGRVAIEMLESGGAFACVILDLMMPSVDGAAVVEHLATRNQPIPVIVCTAVGPLHTPQFDPNVVRAVVRKPFDVEHLTSAVMEVLKPRRVQP